MSELTDSFYDAMKYFVNSASSGTAVIKAEIDTRVDDAKGEYTIKYLNSKMTAYANSSSIYESGEMVYVLVPDGDMLQTKIILASVEPSATTDTILKQANKYYEVGDNLVSIENNTNFYDNEYNCFRLSSYNPSSIVSFNFINDNNYFQTLLKDYRKYQLSFLVKTNLVQDQQIKGNYGVTLSIPVKIEDTGIADENGSQTKKKTLEYSLDVSRMIGDPYGLNVETLQKLIVDIDKQYEIDTERSLSLTVFCKDFPLTGDDYKVNGEYPIDIWIKDIKVCAVEELTEEELTGYQLLLTSSQGLYFTDRVTAPKTITPTLLIDGKESKLSSLNKCYWFVEDPQILVDDPYYLSQAGPGWRCLNSYTVKRTFTDNENSGVETRQYDTSKLSLEVPASDVSLERTYRCVIEYRDALITKDITLIKISQNYDFSLVSEKNAYTEGMGYVNLIAKIKAINKQAENVSANVEYDWVRYDKNGDRLYDPEGFFIVDEFNIINGDYAITKVHYPVYEIEQKNTIQCSAYLVITEKDSDDNIVSIDKKYIGTRNIVVFTEAEVYDYSLNILNDNVLYQYDSDGDSPMLDYYDGPLSSKVITITPLSYKIYHRDGTELSDEEYETCKITWKVAKDCLIDPTMLNNPVSDGDYYIYEGTGKNYYFSYSLAPKYSQVRADYASVLLSIDFNGVHIEKYANVKFIKNGDGGTNGSKYAAVITYNGFPYNTRNNKGNPQKLRLIYDNGTWKSCYSKTEGTGDVITQSLPNINGKKYIALDDDNAFNVKVYKDGLELNNNNYSVIYELFDTNVTLTKDSHFSLSSDGKKLLLNNGNFDTDKFPCPIIRATITINDNNETKSNIYNTHRKIYAYYPLEYTVVTGHSLSTTNPLLPNITGGFDTVTYDQAGENPDYDNSEVFKCNFKTLVDNTSPLYNYYNMEWNSSSHFTKNNNKTDEEYSCIPVFRYNGDTRAYIQIKLEPDNKTNLISKRNKTSNAIENIFKKNIVTLYNLRYKLKSMVNEVINENNNSLNDLKNCFNDAGELQFTGYISSLVTAISYQTSIRQYKAENILTSIDENKYLKSIRFVLNKIFTFDDNNKILSVSQSVLDFIDSKICCPEENNQNIDKNTYESVLSSIDLENLGEYDKLYLQYKEQYNLLNSAIEKVNNIEQRIPISLYHIKPIVITLNTSALGAIEDWDGNKIDLGYDSDNNARGYIYAPQVGAGQKTTDGFSGVVIGVESLNKTSGITSNRKVGLFGYHNNERSIFLNADNGSAIFGKASGGGQIIIDPSSNGKALLYSNGFWQNESFDTDTGLVRSDSFEENGSVKSRAKTNSGMLIDLSTPQILFGSGNFSVNSSGYLHATGGGDIAGWNISDTTLSKNNIILDSAGSLYSQGKTIENGNNGFWLGNFGNNNASSRLLLGSKFRADSDGTVYIGNGAWNNDGTYWTINGDSSKSYISYNTTSLSEDKTNKVYIGTDGISLGQNFKVANNGTLQIGAYATTDGKYIGSDRQEHNDSNYWKIGGSGTTSYIAYNANKGGTPNIDNTNSNSVYIGTNGISLGNTFKVTSEGELSATSGTIGGWTIGSDKLSASSLILNSDGTIQGGKQNTYQSWKINSDGSARFGLYTIDNSGQLTTTGGITLGSSGITASSGTIAANGSSMSGNGIVSAAGVTATGGASSFAGVSTAALVTSLTGSSTSPDLTTGHLKFISIGCGDDGSTYTGNSDSYDTLVYDQCTYRDNKYATVQVTVPTINFHKGIHTSPDSSTHTINLVASGALGKSTSFATRHGGFTVTDGIITDETSSPTITYPSDYSDYLTIYSISGSGENISSTSHKIRIKLTLTKTNGYVTDASISIV